MKRRTIVIISLVVIILDLFCMWGLALSNIKGYAVKYVVTENGPKFKELEGKTYDITEYSEGLFYLADEKGNISETDIQSWRKTRLVNVLSLIVKLVFLIGCLLFFGLGWFYPLFKTIITQKNYILPK